MATLSNTAIFDGSTDGNFRSWTQSINAHMTTGGFWTAASDTGQVDLTTVTHPAQSDTNFAGFKMFRTADTLDSQFRFFMKVEYGTSARFGGSFTPQIRYSFGSATDGAGTLTNIVSSLYLFDPAGNIATGSAGACKSSGGAGYWTFMPWQTVVDVTATHVVAVERAMDSTGAYLSDYMTYLIAYRNGLNGTNVFGQRSLFKNSLGTFSPELTNALTLYINASTAASGSFAAPFPVFPYRGYADNCMTAIMGLKSGDTSEGSQFSTTLYNTSHNYFWTNRGPCALGQATGMTSTGIGIRFE